VLRKAFNLEVVPDFAQTRRVDAGPQPHRPRFDFKNLTLGSSLFPQTLTDRVIQHPLEALARFPGFSFTRRSTSGSKGLRKNNFTSLEF
jgi:hypothetical protein